MFNASHSLGLCSEYSTQVLQKETGVPLIYNTSDDSVVVDSSCQPGRHQTGGDVIVWEGMMMTEVTGLDLEMPVRLRTSLVS